MASPEQAKSAADSNIRSIDIQSDRRRELLEILEDAKKLVAARDEFIGIFIVLETPTEVHSMRNLQNYTDFIGKLEFIKAKLFKAMLEDVE